MKVLSGVFIGIIATVALNQAVREWNATHPPKFDYICFRVLSQEMQNFDDGEKYEMREILMLQATVELQNVTSYAPNWECFEEFRR